jgi:predicted AlkP superfamily phosphohydrolase/phosphomutase
VGSKVLFLGIDALDAITARRVLDSMPHLAAFMGQATEVRVTSTFPPDSDTAWASISTGLNPARHGIVRFVDPLEKSYKIQTQLPDNTALRDRSFWDLAGRAGRSVCVLFPHLGYPLWEVNGVMAARSPVADDVQIFPDEVRARYPEVLDVHSPRGFPGRQRREVQRFVEGLRQLTIRDAAFGLELLGERDWDLFFIYWSTLDAVQHYFWDDYDEEAPGYQEDSPYRDLVPEFYALFDRVLGQFLDRVDDDTAVIVLSDHGHGMRPHRLFNVNELLSRSGLLAARDLERRPDLRLGEAAKQGLVEVASRYRLGRLAGKAMRMFPAATRVFTRPPAIDWERSIAYATDMSGIKAYSYGGVRIEKQRLDGLEYEAVRDRIIELMGKYCVTEEGASLLRFIGRPEELYGGPHLSLYPDVIFELAYGYGVGWSVGNGLYGHSRVSSLMPGSHRGDTPLLLIRTPSSRPIAREVATMMDIAPTVLDLLCISGPTFPDGQSLCPPHPSWAGWGSPEEREGVS